MKRITVILFTLAILVPASFAETYPSLTPKTAESMALGGTFTAIPTSEFSFFGNPAGFAAKKATLALVSTDAWAYVKPTTENVEILKAMGGDTNALSLAGSLMPSNNGIGGGASVGLGFAGRGLGLGFFAVSDNWAEGDSAPGAILTTDTQVSAVVGLGIPFQLGESVRLSVGGDLRPFYRLRGQASVADVAALMEGSGEDAEIPLNAGFGLSADLGASLELGRLTLGLSIRDIAPPFPVWSGTLDELKSSLEEGSLPEAGEGAAQVTLLPAVAAGVSWKTKFLPGLIDPSVYFELQDPVAVFRNADGIGSVLNLTHMGAEVKLLSILSLRAGLNRGWLSAGAGIDLLFVHADVSAFTEELGALPGDKPRSGVSLSAAIRF
jgi:hypothetical protein